MVISRVVSRVTILITHIKGLLTLLKTTPEPPSTPENKVERQTCLVRSEPQGCLIIRSSYVRIEWCLSNDA